MKPLDGITVIAVEHAIAGPFATRQLAEQGATVIKVEHPDRGDFAREYDTRARGQSSHFVWANRSKQSVCLDLKSAAGKRGLSRLIRQADVFLQNLGPGICESLGFGPKEIRAINPNCIICTISGYGSGGPFSNRKAYDLLIQAESGVLSITGTDDTVCKVGLPIADIASAMYAYTNILSALILRQKSGQARHIEISMLEAMTEWMGYPLYYCLDNQAAPSRTGAWHATLFPYGPYTTREGKTVFIAVQHDREWRVFCSQILNDQDLASDARYATSSQRNAERQTLQPQIEQRILQLEIHEALRRLEQAGIAFAELKSVPDLWKHPQLLARHRFVEVETPAGLMPALLPPGASSEDIAMNRVPAIGEHTEEVSICLDDGN